MVRPYHAGTFTRPDAPRFARRANDELTGLLAGIDIAALFLDPDLRIRRYTPAAARILRLVPADIGRRLADSAMDFADRGLGQDAAQLLAGAPERRSAGRPA